MKYLHIRNAKLIDPAQNLDSITDLYIADGLIQSIGEKPASGAIEETLDADAKWLVPGFIDLSTHLQEPGYTHKGTIESETQAAASAGFTQICAQPTSKPIADSSAVIQLIQERSDNAGYAAVLPLGAMTQGLAGEQLANMVSLRSAGAIALSNARHPVKDSYVLRRIMEYAATYDILLFLGVDDPSLSQGGVMHEGVTATRLGLASIPETAETVALAQALLLAEQTGVRIHISQISCARSVDMIREAKQRGLRVTADVALPNLCYTARTVNGFDSRYRVSPPLRSEQDRQALLTAVNQGELAICSNHQPQDIAAKKAPFADAEVGMSLYDCFIPLLLERIHSEELALPAVVRALTNLPAEILGIASGLTTGKPFNATLIDPLSYGHHERLSMGSNLPVDIQDMTGRAVATFVKGRVIYQQKG